MHIFDRVAEMAAAEEQLSRSELMDAEVRIGETFCWEVDFDDVYRERVVYPVEHRLDQDPILAIYGNRILTLNEDLSVTKAE